MSQMRPNKKPVTPEVTMEDLQAESSYGQLVASSCRRFWWLTGDLEITLGLWAIVVGIVCMAFPIDSVSSVLGWLLLGASLVVLVVVPIALRSRVVLPSGVCLSARPRQAPLSGLLTASALLYGGVAIYAMHYVTTYQPTIVVASCAALAATGAYALSGCTRHFLLAAWLQVMIPFVFEKATAFVASGVFGAQAIYGSSGIVGILGLGEALPFALSIISVGVAVLLCGVVAFTSGLIGRVVARAEKDEAIRLIGLLAGDDGQMRFLSVVYLVRNPEPATVIQLLRTSDDENIAIARTARLALTQVWGPTADEMLDWYLGRSNLRGKTPIEFTTGEWHLIDQERRRFEKNEDDRRHAVVQAFITQSADAPALSERLIGLTNLAGSERPIACAAAELLGSTRQASAYRRLVELIVTSDGDREMARAATNGFTGANSEAVSHLLPLYGDRREWVRVCGIDALLGLIETLSGFDSREVAHARELARTEVFSLVADSHAVTRGLSQRLLEGYGADAVPVLERNCHDAAPLVRAQALITLTHVDETVAAPFVYDALIDPRAHVRGAAIYCAEELRLFRAVDRVAVLVNDPSAAVAALANQYLLMMQDW